MSEVLAIVYPDPALVMAEYLSLENTRMGASQLYSLISDRVYIEARPKEGDSNASLVVRNTGGKSYVTIPVTVARLQINCYGAGDSPEAAQEVARHVTLQAHRARKETVTSGILLTAAVSGGGAVIPTPPNIRPFVPLYITAVVRAKES
jgi:hypothetical protein